MKRQTAIILLASMLSILTVPSFVAAGNLASHQELAVHYSPVWYQDVANLEEDAICRVDYDGDWIGNNNWENLDTYWSQGEVRGYVYTSVIETSTHYFITYAAFHPRDWWNLNSDLWSHENDMEGVQVVVEKDGSYYGEFLLMETEAHGQFYQYTNDPTVTNRHEDIDGGVLLYDESHPKVYVESKGHGVYRYDGSDFPGGDGIIYHYGTPEQPSDPYDTNVGYGLVLIQDSLWPLRFDVGDGLTYGTWYEGFWNGSSRSEKYGVTFDGDTYGDDKANPPWGWDDPDDGDVLMGDWFLNPAYAISYHLTIAGPWSTEYTYNYFTNEYDPVVDSITPDHADNVGTVNITNLAGSNFKPGATVKLSMTNQPDINATNVNINPQGTQITCDFNIDGKQAGAWDVTVTNPDSRSATLAGGFTVNPAGALTITSITPASSVENGIVNITNLAGTGFKSGATVRIEKTGTTVNATDVNVVSSTQITCKFNLAGAPLGKYDVVVRNTDAQEARLTQGFSVTNICGGGAAISLSIFGIMMGLMSLAGSTGLRRRFRRKK